MIRANQALNVDGVFMSFLKVRTSIEIPNLSKEVNIEKVSEKINHQVEKLQEKINVVDLGDWSLVLAINLKSSDAIGVAKRISKYSSQKYIEANISIPIPDKTEASYSGVRIPDEAFVKKIDEKWTHPIPPLYENYSSLEDYIFCSAKIAIDFLFEKGVKFDKKSIGFKSK